MDELNHIAEQRDLGINALNDVTRRMECQEEKLRKQRENFE